MVSVMRDKNKIYFLNVTFKVKRNPEYTGNHTLAGCNGVSTTFPLNTTKADMIKKFHAEIVGKINGKTWTKGEIVQVVEIEKCFEDSSEKGRFHKDNY
jgi:hypothetical protein|tara:strand:+ start:303 stop:596 length:294 start_codon:yes stop_codon:yes gene_type:complete